MIGLAPARFPGDVSSGRRASAHEQLQRPVGQRTLLQYGAYLSVNYLSLDDSNHNNHTLWQPELVLYGRLDLDDAQDFFIRGRTGYEDFSRGDSFNGDGEGWFGPKLGQLRKQPLLLLEAFRAPQPVDRLVAGGRGDPRARVVGNTRLRPALQGDDERLLDGLLREVEIAEHPDERRDRPSRLLAKHAVDDCVGFSQTPVSAPELQAGAPGLVDPDRTTVNQPTARRLTQRPRRSPTAAPR